ncbi:SDR family NAD(P)-dependent oxidoreductase [Oricola indica]|jgi:hypothetical protein|uniref:SDR family NAD(P)-dependent oxidoreductase n=1 Tax=Oricola indica TaxID=2872591 RepID=UPI003CCC202F
MSSTPSTSPSTASQPAAVVTGASSGIGKELARLAASEHGAILLVARSSDLLTELATELEPLCDAVAWLSADLADSDAGDRIEAALAERGWHCDVLIEAAGIGFVGPAWETDRADQVATVDINIRALTDLALRFLPGMVKRRSGGLLLVGSISGFFPGPNMAVYYASKAYIRSLSLALHAETRQAGVTVTCLAPGFVTTPFLGLSGLRPTRMRKLLPRITPEQAARAGWRAFRAGRSIVVPDTTTRLVVSVMRMLPGNLATRLIRRLQS